MVFVAFPLARSFVRCAKGNHGVSLVVTKEDMAGLLELVKGHVPDPGR